jgi:uncharacterized membrane protein YqiK
MRTPLADYKAAVTACEAAEKAYWQARNGLAEGEVTEASRAAYDAYAEAIDAKHRAFDALPEFVRRNIARKAYADS